ncbi:glycosyltransferase family 4 protein [Isosphaeraceae bacterium EP7]
MHLAVTFTNFGPYHLARLRALGVALRREGGRLTAYELAGSERRYPWLVEAGEEPFDWTRLFPDRAVELLAASECSGAMREALERDRPDVVAIVGYSRPESMAALGWADRRGLPTILMSESQHIDHPRVWWKEAIKRRRVRRCAAGLVGGPRHRDYLVSLGMPADRIALGYNAVDNKAFADAADRARRDPNSRAGLPVRPYFLAVNRFVPEKNLVRLVRAFARYREAAGEGAWDLVLCGGGPDEPSILAAIEASGHASAVHLPGFLQAGEQAHWQAHAGGFVHPSLMEPWGLVVNEAAACGLPLLVSDRAGCVETLVPDGAGRRFDPNDESQIADCLGWLAGLPVERRAAMGRFAAENAAEWGPERFARGTLEAARIAIERPAGRKSASFLAMGATTKGWSA